MNQEKNRQGVTISKRILVIVVMVIILLVAGSITIGLNWNNWFGEKDTPVGQFNPEIDPNAGNWSENQHLDNNDGQSEGIKIPGYPSIELPANTKDVEVALLNPAGNPCYFTFELVLKDNDEVLYTSKLVPPGQALSQITLSRSLSPGEYLATIKISTTSLKDGSAMNGANVETVLIVK